LKKTILCIAALAVLVSVAPVYARGSGFACEVVSVELYNDVSVSGGTVSGGQIIGGQLVGGSISGQDVSTSPCANVTMKMVAPYRSSLGGKIIAVFADGSTKERQFDCDRVSTGQVYEDNICWGKKKPTSIKCEF
jgi:hypothetical protein